MAGEPQSCPPTLHPPVCFHEADFIILKAQVSEISGRQVAMMQSMTVIEHALLGNLTDPEREGLLSQHHEHRTALFGDKKKKGDKGVVGTLDEVKEETAEIKKEISNGKWFARGVTAGISIVVSVITVLGWKGIAAVCTMLAGKGVATE